MDSDRDKLSSNRLSMDTCASELRQAQKSGSTEKIPALTSHLHRATEDFNKSRVRKSSRHKVYAYMCVYKTLHYMYVRMYICMYVCTCVRMYVCMYVCMCLSPCC